MKNVPKSLRIWFIIHFIVDTICGTALILATDLMGVLFNIPSQDNFSPRLVGAALMAIGITSFLIRNEDAKVYSAFLTFNMLWSFFALIAASVYALTRPSVVILILLVIFLIFSATWTYYKRFLDY